MTALKFPAHVPMGACNYITEFMDGTNGSGGFVSLRNSKRKELSEVEQRLKRLEASGDVIEASRERDKYDEIKHQHDYLEAQVACMQRFAQDDLNMKDAYAHLTGVLEDHQWERFLYSAWAARKDYQHYRDRLDRAKKVCDEIAEAANRLAALLNESMEIGLNYPYEFFSIPTLLGHTENTESVNDGFMWQAVRPVVLGLHPRKASSPAAPSGHDSSDSQPGFHLILQKPGDEQEPIDPSEKMMNAVSHAWEKAPYLPALLETLAQSAQKYEPRETGSNAAAIVSRKGNRKYEYLRALATLLTESHIELSTPIKKAMAIVAMVALDDSNLDVSYDEVHKIITGMKSKPPEDSAEK